MTGDKHNAAQAFLIELLKPHYGYVQQEALFEVVNPKYIWDSSQRPTIEYFFDVFAQWPKHPYKYDKLGIEIDGGVGHKKTKYQFIRDEHRTASLELEYGFLVHRFDPEQVIGQGYRNPKTKKIIRPWSPTEILYNLGISL